MAEPGAAPLLEPSEYGFCARFHGHRGVSLRMRSGKLCVSVPDFNETPIRLDLAGRSVTIAPEDSCWLHLPGN
ncbi:glycosyl hydrolase family 65 protein [Streptomyces zagrosensis]|uniref:Glycoside hydrolase family 65 C-terminal domain-containing protein n=1 Tax=Streptomyces zagrosensis TaxID=1042984 RepID=A0A7W9V1Z3_9ACTN|nr:glycosyl hydrolase family 65 protein [Streptomyces zagrosensis]MBB5939720.1 hypothetical protein [Streptomyces zagrosensis]